MNNLRDILSYLLIMAAFGGFTGCSLTTLESRMDMAVTRMAESKKPEFEGRLIAIREVGAMFSLQFADGRLWNIDEAPQGLQAGDIVRIYKTYKGYRAHLWERPNELATRTTN
jgi:hypothetical protein